ncbi:MAG: DUF364 domain-containing protein [Anaerolineae bacterium]|nr:DUF364 domain-containing protein [Anaerolineae bacterium]
MIVDDILATIRADCPVRAVWIGQHWTAVALADGRGGMASSLSAPGEEHGHPQVREAGRLHTLSALALASYVKDGQGPEVSVGWAVLNALVSDTIDVAAHAQADALDYLLTHGAGRRVALVGHFPFTPRLRAGVGHLDVFELAPGAGDLPASEAPARLPAADLVAITSMTLVNGTCDALIAHCRPGVPILLLGPSTPLSPVLFAHGVDALAGVIVCDMDALARTITQGATFQQVEGVQKVTLTRAAWSSGVSPSEVRGESHANL